ncbi:MAG: hypothetical protein JXB32_23550 [Deltaproteobacteria bacterium]|nr:hypothetical protein [Deltaproteobacteria bacterium]
MRDESRSPDRNAGAVVDRRLRRAADLCWMVVGWLMLGGCGNGARQGDGDAVDGLVAHDADGGGPDAPGDDGTAGGDDADERPEVLVPPNCGDGVVDPGEECDDGNRLNGDECDWACRTGSGEPPPVEPLDEVADSDTLTLLVTGSDIWASGPSRQVGGPRLEAPRAGSALRPSRSCGERGRLRAGLDELGGLDRLVRGIGSRRQAALLPRGVGGRVSGPGGFARVARRHVRRVLGRGCRADHRREPRRGSLPRLRLTRHQAG